MTFIRKFNGKTERADRADRIIAVYTCPEHGEFDAEVQRDENGEAPDAVPCEHGTDATIRPHHNRESGYALHITLCSKPATWTPSPVAGRVRRIEAVKGRWEKPERPTYLDTRSLGEGQDIDDFREQRAAVWERKRQEDVMAVKKGFG